MPSRGFRSSDGGGTGQAALQQQLISGRRNASIGGRRKNAGGGGRAGPADRAAWVKRSGARNARKVAHTKWRRAHSRRTKRVMGVFIRWSLAGACILPRSMMTNRRLSPRVLIEMPGGGLYWDFATGYGLKSADISDPGSQWLTIGDYAALPGGPWSMLADDRTMRRFSGFSISGMIGVHMKSSIRVTNDSIRVTNDPLLGYLTKHPHGRNVLSQARPERKERLARVGGQGAEVDADVDELDPF